MTKKLLKKIVVAVMAATMMMTATGTLPAKTASAAKIKKSGDYKYIKYRNGVKLSNYLGKANKLTIPAKIAGKKVIAIESNTFRKNKTLKQVKIPDSVKKIGSHAFADCTKLKKITLPKKLEKIGDGAFMGTALTKIKIPKGVKKIAQETFTGCKNLKKVTLGEDVRIIENNAFAGCELLSNINFDNIEEIGMKAFENNKSLAGDLVFKNVVTLGTVAFYGCSGITSVSFSDTLQSLDEKVAHSWWDSSGQRISVDIKRSSNPFAYCTGIEKFEVDVNNANYSSIDGVIYDKTNANYSYVDHAIYDTTNDWIVAYPAKKGSVVNIPDTIKGICDYAFSGAQVSQINMGKEMEIGKEAFGGCSATQVNMPLDGEWSYDAFLDCKSLEKVVFPEGARYSNDVAFVNCTALTDVILPEGMEVLSYAMFFGCTALENITLPKEVTEVPTGCFYGCKSLKNVNLENIESIGEGSFFGCEALSGVLNLNTKTINPSSFAGCTGITEVNFNKPLTGSYNIQYYDEDEEDDSCAFCYRFRDGKKLYNNPFAGCISLKKINVAAGGNTKSVDGVMYSADMKTLLSYPAGLTGNFNIPYGVEVIANAAFEGTNISEVVCSNSVKYIYSRAFYNSKVKSVTLSETVTMISEANIMLSGTDIFEGCSELEQIKVHASNNRFKSKDGVLYHEVPGYNKVLLIYPPGKKGEVYKVPEKTYINKGAFNGCKYLKKVYITDMKNYNEGNYFKNCNNVKLYLPKNFVPKTIIKPKTGKYSFGFDKSCTGCKTYVKKGSKLTKKLEKMKVAYNKY